MSKILASIHDEIHQKSLTYNFPFESSELIREEEIGDMRQQSQCSYIDDVAFWLLYPLDKIDFFSTRPKIENSNLDQIINDRSKTIESNSKSNKIYQKNTFQKSASSTNAEKMQVDQNDKIKSFAGQK